MSSLGKTWFHKKTEEWWNNLTPLVSHGPLLCSTTQVGAWAHSDHTDHRLPQKAFSFTLEAQKQKREQTNNRHAAVYQSEAGYRGLEASKVNQGWRRPLPHIKRTLAFRCFLGWRNLWPLGLLTFFSVFSKVHPAQMKAVTLLLLVKGHGLDCSKAVSTCGYQTRDITNKDQRFSSWNPTLWLNTADCAAIHYLKDMLLFTSKHLKRYVNNFFFPFSDSIFLPYQVLLSLMSCLHQNSLKGACQHQFTSSF